jgi:spectinomycin phosphotransferase
MLEEPQLDHETLRACLRADYGLPAVEIVFLPLGADQNTAVYRAVAGDGRTYFVKLRREPFDETSVALPKWLHDRPIAQIIAPLTTHSGRLRADLDVFKVVLYPFIGGRDGYEVELTDRQWVDLGAGLKRIHTTRLPAALSRRIRRETYAPQWRQSVRAYLSRVADETFDDPLAVRLAALLTAERDQIRQLVERAEQLAQALAGRDLAFILCHSDLHAGNLLIVDDDTFYIVDWDDPILAPKERDLMFIGGGLMGGWRPAAEEERLFYRGYGATEIDPLALAYYRYERIIQDIAVECEQILLTAEGADREQLFGYLVANFRPDGTIELARRSDPGWRGG